MDLGAMGAWPERLELDLLNPQQGTVPIPPVVNPAGTPAFQAVITKLEQMEREATLRRVALEGYAKAVEAFVRNSPDEQKKFVQEIQEGRLAYLNQHLFGTAAAKQPSKTSYAGPSRPRTHQQWARTRRQNASPRKNAPPHQNKVGNPESWARRRPQMQQLRRCYIENTRGRQAQLVRPRPNALVVMAPSLPGISTAQPPQKRADGKIVRLTASQLGEIRRQQTATRKACELAAKSQQERGPKSGVQVVIPTPGARIAAYEAADQQSRRVKRKTAPTGSLNLVELSKRSVYAVSDDEASPTLSNVISSIQVPPNFLIGGDFNAKHDMFEPGVGSSNQGASLAAWSLSSGADFIGEPGEPTHRAGHTIDLTFSNIPFAETTVRHDLDCGSDHFTLVTLLPGRGQGADGNAGYRVTEAKPTEVRARH
ncbi:hypothetical protein DID88_008762 [Monilinia fructigena]|uniref:Endonuclease/exonuclease/phosphatase domain-containing protein n=1 Tax=Monilinia fructigena TaxID=38457 RepID=A0A395JBD0_9HELO|nr:hypothetical protein DID88_008762 [Monilinia fructigena]